MVSAYPSRAAFQADYLLGAAEDPAAACVALQYEFLTPESDRDPDAVLRDVADLARDDTFRQRRQEFYHWQADYLAGNQKLSPTQAVGAMHEMVLKYNESVKQAERKLLKKSLFCIGAAALSVTGSIAGGNPLPLAGTVLSLVQFLTLDRRVVVSAGRAAPAAMFHDAERVLGR